MQNIIFWAISQHEKWMLCYNERYTLLLDCFISLLMWIRKLTGASASIYKPLMVHIMSFVPKTTSKIHEIYQNSGSFSVGDFVCGAAMRGIHCCLTV